MTGTTDLPRPRPPHLHRETTRHGRVVWYVRLDRGPRIRMRAAWGTPEFQREYEAALGGERPADAPAQRRPPPPGTFAWALQRYRESAAWTGLSPATRRQRALILAKVEASAGAQPLAAFTPAKIAGGVDRRAATPAAARHFVESLRGFFRWALRNALVSADPTASAEVPRKSGPGFPAWTEEDAAAFEALWPPGTRERMAYEIFVCTGLRISDAAVFGRQHVRAGVAEIQTFKTGERVWFAISQRLQAAIDAGPTGALTFIAGERGGNLRKEALGNWFRGACRAAGIAKSAHGLRKLAATRDAEDGWSQSELDAKYGWRGGRMAAKYTDAMNRKRLALNAAARTEQRTPIPAPSGTTPAPEKIGSKVK